MPNLRSEDLSDIFTHDGIQRLKKGQLLRFDYEGSIIEFIITYINKKTDTIRGRRTKTYTQAEARDLVEIVERKKKK